MVNGESALKAAAAVDCPVPPRAMLNCPVHPKVRFCVVIVPVMLVSLLTELTVVAGSRAAAKMPEEMLAALVVSVVAEGAKETPLVFVHVTALDAEVVQSPDNSAELKAEPLDLSRPAEKLVWPVPPEPMGRVPLKLIAMPAMARVMAMLAPGLIGESWQKVSQALPVGSTVKKQSWP